MRIFLSHASRDKPLVREIVGYLPESLTIWLDENDLPLGAEIRESLKKIINEDSDLIILFISPESVSSSWVKQELEWAISREKVIGGIFIFPIILDISAWKDIEPKEFQDRKYLQLQDFSSESIKSVATKLERAIFDWLVSKKDGPRSVPVRVKDFELDISAYAGNVVRRRELFEDNSIPENEAVIVRLSIDNPDKKNTRKKNSEGSGLPYIGVELVNKGADIELDDVMLQFNPSSSPSSTEELIDGKINPEMISSISLSNSLPNQKDMHLLSNHKESFGLHAKIALEQVLLRGIKNIVVTDVSGNKYYPPEFSIREAEEYLHTFFEYSQLDKLYEVYEI